MRRLVSQPVPELAAICAASLALKVQASVADGAPLASSNAMLLAVISPVQVDASYLAE